MNREQTIAALKLAQQALCTYAGPTCDCKYGASGRGEQTGCPEMRALIETLEREEHPRCLSVVAFAGPNAYPITCDHLMPCALHAGEPRPVIDMTNAARSTDP